MNEGWVRVTDKFSPGALVGVSLDKNVLGVTLWSAMANAQRSELASISGKLNKGDSALMICRRRSDGDVPWFLLLTSSGVLGWTSLLNSLSLLVTND